MPTSVLPAWFADAHACLRAGDIDGWLAMFAADGVHEFPWAPADRVSRLEGREAMAAYLSQMHGRIVFGELVDIRVREAGDETIIQATGHNHRPDGTPRSMRYVWFLTRRDGKVTLLQDYVSAIEPA